jgi:hypothetical protein
MITVDEIRKKSERKYEEILTDSLKGNSCFPLIIRSNKALSKDFRKMSNEIAEVISASKDRKGYGYSVISETIKTRHHGIQDIPKSIAFETNEDYLRFINKKNEFIQMMKSFQLIRSELPQLYHWLIKNPKTIISNNQNWPDLIKVCKWFINNYEPNKYYIRELLVAVHTKFIEENKTVLRSLLDELIPDNVNAAENNFEKRFGLKYDQPLVRIRSLDSDCWAVPHYQDLSVPIGQFISTQIDCKRVFIIENKMNFLTFPSAVQSFAIWGKGFSLEILKEVNWLNDKEIFYWSDIDVQGFQMLSQLRSYFPQTQSLLMDREILDAYNEFVVPGTISKVKIVTKLTNEESDLHRYLMDNNLRLEQERIHQEFIYEYIQQIL